MSDAILDFVGRTHLVLLHVPIGVLVALAAFEALALARRQPADRSVRLLLVWLAAVSAASAAGAGWLLASDGYAGQTLTLHRWLGVALAAALAIAALASSFGCRFWYPASLLAALVLLVPTGHFGGTITHGEGFLTAPFRTPRQDLPAASSAEVVEMPIPGLPADVGAVFVTYCVECHNDTKKKAGLAMHTAEALFAGSDYGAVVVAGDPDQSELAIRMLLPIGDEYHMPPDDRPQPSEAEVRAVVEWITHHSFGG